MEVPKQESQKERKQRDQRPPKAPRAEKGSESPNKPAGAEGESPRRRNDRPPRNDDWKIELEKSMTVDTKIPAMPKDEELLKRPDPNVFRATMDKLAKKIEKNFAEIDELKKQEKELREDIFAKNNAEFVELRKLGEQRKELAGKMDVSKKAKEEIKAQIAVLEDKKSKLEKKGLGGRILPKERLEEIMAEKEREHKNSLKTAADEKRYLDEISKLKEILPLASEVNKVTVQIDALIKRQKEINASNKPIVAELDAIRAKADILRSKLGLNDKKEEGEKKEEAEKKEKPKRELTAEEKDLQAKRQALFDQINKLKEQKGEVYARHQKENDAYFKQQDEIYKIKFMTGLLKKLKAVEKQQKWEADKEKRQAAELEEAKNRASAKFNGDIELCNGLLDDIEGIRLREKMQAEGFGSTTDVKGEYKVDDKTLKAANLVMLKPKKDDNEGVQPGQKRLNKKAKKTDTAPQETQPKLDIAAATLTSLAKLGISVPASLADLDKTIELVRAKKDNFEKLKNEAHAQAEAQFKAGVETKGDAEETLPEEKNEKPKPAPEKKKDVQFDEVSFPSLE